MAINCVRPVYALLVATLALLAAAPQAAAPPANGTSRGLEISYDSTEFTPGGGAARVSNLTIRDHDPRGNVTITVNALSATTNDFNFENSTWTLTGNVSVTMAEGELKADSAVVTLARGALANATVRGQPATFRQLNAIGAGNGRGRANEIGYSVAAGEVRLSGDAWFGYANSESSCRVITYQLATQKVNVGGEREAADGTRCETRYLPKGAAVP